MATRYPKFAVVTESAKRFRPSELLPVLSEVASRIDQPDQHGRWRVLAPWSLAAVARECLLRSNEHRASRVVSEGDVLALNDVIRMSHDEPKTSTVGTIMLPLIYEQFPWQESDAEELLRSVVLFDVMWRRVPELGLTADDLVPAFGTSVFDIAAAAGAIFVAASAGNGSAEPELLSDPILLERCAEQRLAVPTAEALSLVVDIFTADQGGFRADYAKAYPKGLPPGHQARYAYNPLVKFPLVRLPGGTLVAPAPRFITRRASPAGLYYAAVDYFNAVPSSNFTGDFGRVVEAYVGENLRLLEGVEVLPEIVYRSSGSEAKSVDWIVIFDSLVLLVEAKAARVGITARTGSDTAVKDFGARLDEAAKQINRTAAHIERRHPSFAHIPADRPIVGIGVTAEPFYMANGGMMRASLEHSTERIVFASLRDLERLVLYPAAQVADALLQIVEDEELAGATTLAGSIREVVGDPPRHETPMLAEARARLGL